MPSPPRSTATAQPLGAVLLLLGGCSSGAIMASGADEERSSATMGQSLVLVGVDADLQEALWIVEAGGDGESLLDAATFRWTRAVDLGSTGPLAALGELSFDALPAEVPWAQPDGVGRSVAFAVHLSGGDSDLRRPVIYDHSTASVAWGDPVLGLADLRFVARGAYLVARATTSDGQASAFVLPTSSISDAPRWFALPPGESLEGIEVAPTSDSIVAWGQGADGPWLRLDHAATGDAAGPALLPPGRIDAVDQRDDGVLAVAWTSEDGARSDVAILDADLGFDFWLSERGGLDADCGAPLWSPAPTAWALAATCHTRGTGRPDLAVLTADSVVLLATSGPQPAVPEGTMDSLVLRSAPFWAPDGGTVYFGASTADEAYLGQGMTLLALPESTGRAFPLVSVTESELDWAHVSTGSAVPTLLLWDRAAPASEPSMRVVPLAEGGAGRTLAPDVPMLVSYPFFWSD